jgi:hypothetical protein
VIELLKRLRLKTTSINSHSKYTKEKEMADFRKWFLVLAVLAAVAIPVSAQTSTPFSCVITPGQPPIIRDGGLSELVGDVVLQCSGSAPNGSAATSITTNIQVFLTPTDVTNRVKSGSLGIECPTGIACVTDALLLVTDSVLGNIVNQGVGQFTSPYVLPIVGLLQSNLSTSDAANTRNSILFPNVTLPYGTTTFIRITNIRVVAPAASNTSLPTQVFELVSTNPFGAFPITNPTQTVAYVQVPVQFATRKCDDSGTVSTTFQQCISQPVTPITFNAKFTEGFALAFKPRAIYVGAVPTQSLTGTAYNTESGLIWPAAVTAIGGTSWAASTTSYADTGTELLVRFSNIPAGVSIYVTNQQTVSGTSSQTIGGVANTPLLTAALRDPASTTSVNTACGANAYTALQVPISNGTGSATWEITSVVNATGGAIAAQKSISFGVVVAYTSNTSAGLPGLTGTTPGAVSGELAPISAVDYADKAAAIPRFRDNPQGGQVFNIIPCVSNLLFPFVTNQAGFDTGIALVNTSLDNAGSKQPFNTNTQHGTCTVYYFNGTASAPAPQVTPDIVAGGMNTFTLQSGGVFGSTSSAQGFQGYIIARCNFQYAHGYAFISDRNTPSVGSQGYLALIIPDRAGVRPPDPFTTAGAGAGEQLTN